MKNFLSILSVVFLLSGCATSFNFTVQNVPQSEYKIHNNLKEICINPSKKDLNSPRKVTIEIPKDASLELHNNLAAKYPVVVSWGTALKYATIRSNLFDKSADKKLSLLVDLIAIDIPCFGFSFTTHVEAEYKLVDNATDTILYNDTVKSKATIPLNYSFLGRKRALESINRAVQNNIYLFISNIQNNKPLL